MNKQLSSNNREKSPILVIDPVYKLIRIHRTTLNILNRPTYIQFFVNPYSKSIIICEGSKKDPLAHQVNYTKLNFGKCYELYSKALVLELIASANLEKCNHLIRLSGTFLSQYQAVIFNLQMETKKG